MAEPRTVAWALPQGLPIYTAFVRQHAGDEGRFRIAQAEAAGERLTTFSRLFVRGRAWVAEIYFERPNNTSVLGVVVQLGNLEQDT